MPAPESENATPITLQELQGIEARHLSSTSFSSHDVRRLLREVRLNGWA